MEKSLLDGYELNKVLAIECALPYRSRDGSLKNSQLSGISGELSYLTGQSIPFTTENTEARKTGFFLISHMHMFVY